MTIYATAAQRRPVLVSPGYGAGWATWADDESAAMMLTYQEIIDAIERGDTLSDEHVAVRKMVEDLAAAGQSEPYLGGLRQLTVVYVEGDFDVTEYDGRESVVQHGTTTRIRV